MPPGLRAWPRFRLASLRAVEDEDEDDDETESDVRACRRPGPETRAIRFGACLPRPLAGGSRARRHLALGAALAPADPAERLLAGADGANPLLRAPDHGLPVLQRRLHPAPGHPAQRPRRPLPRRL